MAGDKSIFPFFRLAKELRDAIYDMTKADFDDDTTFPLLDLQELTHVNINKHRGITPGYDLPIRVKGGPYLHLLLVSRRFSSEYADRAKYQDATLMYHIQARGYWYLTGEAGEKRRALLDLPAPLQHVRKVELLYQMGLWPNLGPSPGYVIQALAASKNVQEIVFKIFVQEESQGDDLDYWPESAESKALKQSWLDMVDREKKLVRAELHWYCVDHKEQQYLQSKETCTKTQGWEVKGPRLAIRPIEKPTCIGSSPILRKGNVWRQIS